MSRRNLWVAALAVVLVLSASVASGKPPSVRKLLRNLAARVADIEDSRIVLVDAEGNIVGEHAGNGRQVTIDLEGLPLIFLQTGFGQLEPVFGEELDFESSDCTGTPWTQRHSSVIPPVFHGGDFPLFVGDLAAEETVLELRSSRSRFSGNCFTFPSPNSYAVIPALETQIRLDGFAPPYRFTTRDRLE